MRLRFLSHRWPAKAQGSLRIRAVSPEPLLFAHMKNGSRRRVRPKIRHLAPLDGCACAFEEWVYWRWKRVIISWDGSIVTASNSINCVLFCLESLLTAILQICDYVGSHFGWVLWSHDIFRLPASAKKSEELLKPKELGSIWGNQTASAQSDQRLCCSLPR